MSQNALPFTLPPRTVFSGHNSTVIMPTKKIVPAPGPLVKSVLADRLRAEISSGALAPGTRIVEGTWGRKLDVAQGSIREAINLLAQEGFVTKISGRSARVVNLKEQDVLQLYDLRTAIEGVAARLVAERRADITELEEAVEAMRRTSAKNRTAELVDADREFHLELCRLSGNPHLVELASRIMLPFFAFARIRVVVCEAVKLLARPLQGRAIDELMADFGAMARALADDPILRWLGPYKGVVHLALASITNACFDLWAKARGVPLWRLLLDLEPEQLVRLLDLSYLEDVLDENTALALVQCEMPAREQRSSILQKGYPGYDTSVGWMAYDDSKVRELTKQGPGQRFRRIQAQGWFPGPVTRSASCRYAARMRR